MAKVMALSFRCLSQYYAKQLNVRHGRDFLFTRCSELFMHPSELLPQYSTLKCRQSFNRNDSCL